jgi:dihydropyrimidinase
MASYDLIVKGGRLVDATNVVDGDLCISDGTVQAVVHDAAPGQAARVVDARGCYVLPGILDAHVHPIYADSMESLSLSAAHGGITTLIHFIGSGNFTAWGAKPEWSLADSIQHFRAEGEAVSYLDFAFHAAIAQADDHRATIPAAVALGVTSFKMFLAYKSRGMMLSDDQMLDAMETMRDSGALAMVHAESGCAIDHLEQKLIAAGKTSAEHYLPSRPNALEEEATFRATTFARVAGCPLYVVHMSCREALAVTTRAKANGQAVYSETCPHYLVLTDEAVRQHGANFKIGPPLRSRPDVEALWRAIRDGRVDVIASDHGAHPQEAKRRGADNIFAAPFGVPGAETLLPLVYHFGVHQGRIPITRLVELLAEGPAKIFGLYPRKGTWQVGADGDVVLLDPSGSTSITATTQHSRAGYTAYEGMELRGRVVHTIQRGRTVLDRGTLTARPGWGRFLSREGRPVSSAGSPAGSPAQDPPHPAARRRPG